VSTQWDLLGDGDDFALASQPRVNGKRLAARTDHKTPYETALEMLREATTGQSGQFTPAEIEAQASETVQWCRDKALAIVRQINDQSLHANSRLAYDRADDLIVETLLNDLFGMGPIEELFRLPDVEDIVVNGPNDIWYKARGGWVKSPVEYDDAEALQIRLNRAIVHTGRQVGPLTPIVDATLRHGHRINIVTAPLADPWPIASIRIHRDKSLTMEELVAGGGVDHSHPEPIRIPNYFAHDTGQGMFSALAATFLHMAAVAGFNVLVVGATGVGKTTVLGALGRMIPGDRRLLTIEDTPELNFRGGRDDGRAENSVSFRTRPATVEGLPAITQRDLVIAALRQRPDALAVGEARGAEVFDMLKAQWTGHRNGLTSIHADSLEDVPNRIRMMLQEAHFETEVTEATVSLWIAKAFHLGLMLRRTDTGRRYVEEITEYTGGVEGSVPVRTPLFIYDPDRRRLMCTGHHLDPFHEAMLAQAGYSYDSIIQAAEQKGELL
jgi:pilus assembly protein CpaF